MSWPIVDVSGTDYYSFEALFPVEPDPVTGVGILLLKPSGGAAGVNIPAIENGDDGPPPQLTATVALTELDYDDPTPASSTWTLTDPGPPPEYTETRVIHMAAPPDPPDVTLIGATDLDGTPLAGKIIVVNTAADGFEYAVQKVGDRYVPTSIASAPSGQTGYTLATIGIPAFPFAWRPIVYGQCVIAGTGADMRADLIARLDGVGGNIVGRGFGTVGVNTAGIPTVLSAGPPANSNDAYDKVAASTSASIYIRVERQSGGDTFTTSDSTSWFCVRVQPVP